jgi:hypothetical protein
LEFFANPDLYSKIGGLAVYNILLEFVSEWTLNARCEGNITPQIITNFFVDLVDSLFVFDDKTRKMLGYFIGFNNTDFPSIYEDKNCLEQRALGNFFIRVILYQILWGFEEEYFSGIKVTYRFLTLSENPLEYRG